MRFAVLVFLAAFLGLVPGALAHGKKKHSKTVSPAMAASKTPDKKPDINQEKKDTGGQDEHNNKDGHHNKLKGETGELVTNQQHSEKKNDQNDKKIETAKQKADEAVSALKYRATVMVFGFVVLVTGLAIRYLPGKSKADAS